MKFSPVAGSLACVVVVGLALTACGGSTPAATSSGQPQTASILNNWFAQAEQGGYWEAMNKQYAKDKNITLKVEQGGPGIQTIPQVAAGQADFGVANADEVMVARSNGLPIVAIAAGFDTNLQCMMFHQGQSIASFSDLNGHQVSRVPSPYFDYLKSHFKLNNIQDINFTGSMADFKINAGLVQQCFVTAEPYLAKQAGISIGVLSVAKDGGYNPYGNLLFTSDSEIAQHPDVVRAVVAAVVQGWTDFLADPSGAKTAVLAANKNADPAAFDYAAQTIKSGGFLGTSVGAMTDARWKALRDQLASVGDVPASFDYTTAFTTKFLP
jgi:NitT/TauT family transport system substrate-binding protein